MLVDCADQFCLNAAIARVVDFEDVMVEESLARLRAHRQNIDRYCRLMRTSLTALEQDFIERRIAEELLALDRLATETFPTLTLSEPKAAIALQP